MPNNESASVSGLLVKVRGTARASSLGGTGQAHTESLFQNVSLPAVALIVAAAPTLLSAQTIWIGKAHVTERDSGLGFCILQS